MMMLNFNGDYGTRFAAARITTAAARTMWLGQIMLTTARIMAMIVRMCLTFRFMSSSSKS